MLFLINGHQTIEAYGWHKMALWGLPSLWSRKINWGVTKATIFTEVTGYSLDKEGSSVYSAHNIQSLNSTVSHSIFVKFLET